LQSLSDPIRYIGQTPAKACWEIGTDKPSTVVDHAKELMSQTSMLLIEVAIQSGFNDQAAFTHTFHQLVGVSPGR